MRFSTLVFPKDTSNFYFIKRDINPPMDFSSVPIYLDPPPNWHQQSNHHHRHHPQISSNNNGSPQHQHHLLSLPTQQLSSAPLSHVSGGGGVSSIRRGSMADRARMANVPLPETALKCPRCDSTNTKFCYFNNYSLSQPRHFCKSCRRYWTRGGALRNVPVGGGCRRNKKNKTRRSKSPAAAPAGNETQVMNNNSNSPTTTTIPLHSSAENIIGHLQPQHPHLSFMASLNNFSRYGTTSLGLNFNEIQAQGNDIGNGALVNHHLWRGSQNFPLSGGLETPPGLYPFQISGGDGDVNTTNSILTPNSRATHLPPVKIEETQVLNLLKSSNLGINNSENNQFWSNGNGWTDLSAISSTSSGHISCDFNH